jgi:4-alpha-glucanotransferase
MPKRGRFSSGRHAGVLVPLFSIPSRRSWGIGEIPDLAVLGQWLESAGLDFVQILPVNEMQEGQSSPYSALSAMAIDPIFIALDDVDDWIVAAGTDGGMSEDDRLALAHARTTPRVNYSVVRGVKNRALRKAFAWFATHVWGSTDRRAKSLQMFEERERWWLDDYALFRALHDAHGGRSWREWEAGIRDRDPSALAAAREQLAWQVRYYAYLQWLADEQWQRVRLEMSTGIFGDFPFMVSAHSADVWSRQHEFDLDASVGTPPDAFSATGQDWGLPAYRWDVLRENGYLWLRERTRRSLELFDGFRIDHLIGFYRTYVRREGSKVGSFLPAEEAAQRAQGEELLAVFGEGGGTLIGEDLGTVPDYMRVSLVERGIPGMKVLRWERDWHADGHPFHDARQYHEASVATTGTHDTETLAEWWDKADPGERKALVSLSGLREAGVHPDAPFTDHTRDAFLNLLFNAGSRLLILPMQDIFGWRDRINTPALISDENWTWRLPGPVEDLTTETGAHERAAFLRGLAERSGRA